MAETTGVAADVARLRDQHPGWFFTTTAVAAGSGPDQRMLIAQRNGTVLADLTTEALSAKIRAEEQGEPRD